MYYSLHLLLFLALMQGVVGNFFEVGMTEGRRIVGTGSLEINVRIQKINKTTYAMSGNVKIKVPLDDNYQLRSLLYKKQGNEYRLTAFHIGPYNFCDYIQNRAVFYNTLRECSDLPPKEECPWMAREIQINKCLVPTDKIPTFLRGDYRLDVEVLQNDESLGGYQIFAYIISFI